MNDVHLFHRSSAINININMNSMHKMMDRVKIYRSYQLKVKMYCNLIGEQHFTPKNVSPIL